MAKDGQELHEQDVEILAEKWPRLFSDIQDRRPGPLGSAMAWENNSRIVEMDEYLLDTIFGECYVTRKGARIHCVFARWIGWSDEVRGLYDNLTTLTMLNRFK